MKTPDRNCPFCPRLAAFRTENRQKFPDFFNAPVPGFGDMNSELLIVGLAPGLKGANFTGRPFTGDYAGTLLYGTLLKYGFATGRFDPAPFYEGGKDTLRLENCRISNAVKCVPPENKPTPAEMNTCRVFIESEIAAMPRLKLIVTLGLISHQSTLRSLGQKPAAYKFAHNVLHPTPQAQVLNSYHCSRYNTSTGRLTESMFHDVFEKARSLLD